MKNKFSEKVKKASKTLLLQKTCIHLPPKPVTNGAKPKSQMSRKLKKNKMEKVRFLLVMLCMAFIVSCSKDNDSDIDTKLNAEKISAKWNISGSSEFESFEFNKSGNYIIIKNGMTRSTDDPIILFGTYQIVDSIITLSGFGKITVSDITENSISAKLVLNDQPNNVVEISATKQKEMEKSTKTDLLCKTWELLTANDESVKGTEYDLTVLFSAAGTYYVDRKDGGGGLAEWKWKDSNENIFLYSWDNWDEFGEVSIIELVNDKLVMFEDSGEDGTETFVLQPLDNSKPSTLKSMPVSQTNKVSVRKGLMGNKKNY